MADATKQLVEQAKQTFFEKFTGAVLRRKAVFGHPITQRFFRRYFEITSRNAHFINVFGRVLLGEERVKEPEEVIDNRIRNVIAEIQTKIEHCKAIMQHSGSEEMASYNKPEEVDVIIVSRTARGFYDMLCLSDQYLQHLSTLWLLGLIDDTNRTKNEYELKSMMRKTSNVIRQSYITLRTQHSKLTKASAADTELVASDSADVEQPVEQADPADVMLEPVPA